MSHAVHLSRVISLELEEVAVESNVGGVESVRSPPLQRNSLSLPFQGDPPIHSYEVKVRCLIRIAPLVVGGIFYQGRIDGIRC